MERKKILQRLQSWPVWLAVIGQLPIILAATGLMPEEIEQIQGVLIAVGEILALFGLLNNPTDPNHF